MSETVKALNGFPYPRYDQNFLSVPILAEDDLFVQMNGYEVYLPLKTEEQTLNLFESSVLKLLALNSYTAAELGEMLCLDTEFVQVILEALQSRSFLDDSLKITAAGKACLGSESDHSNKEVRPFLLLLTRDTQEILPRFFPAGDLRKAALDQSFLKLTQGSAGKQQKLQGKVLFVKEPQKHLVNLDQESIHRFVTQWNRRQPLDKRIYLDSSIHIDSTYVCPVYLHVKAALQDGNVGYWVATSGAEPNEMLLRDYLERNEKNIGDLGLWLKKRAQRIVDDSAENKKKQTKKDYYWQIRNALYKINGKNETYDDYLQLEEQNKSSVGGLVAAIEWGLNYSLRQVPPPQQLLKMIEIQNSGNNQKMLMDFAKKIGIPQVEKFPELFRGITAVKVKNALAADGTPSIETLLPIAIATAAGNANYRLPDALETMPAKERRNPLSFFVRMLLYGRQIRHNSSWSPRPGDTEAYLRGIAERFLKALLPGFESDSIEEEMDTTNASVARINAELGLRDAMGKLFDQLPDDLISSLMTISPEKNELQVPSAAKFITILCALAEYVLLSWLKQQPMPNIKTKSELFQKMDQLEFPKVLKTVKEYNYERACNHQNATLGAYMLAVFATLCTKEDSEEKCRKILQSGLPELVGKLTTLRGHGNQAGLLIKWEDLKKLRDSTFEVCKNFGGNLL